MNNNTKVKAKKIASWGMNFMKTRAVPKFIKLMLAGLLVAGTVQTQVLAQGDYLINAGDALNMFVWNEELLTRDVRVRPDGVISVPIVGDVPVGGHSVTEAEQMIVKALSKYLKDAPTVTLSVIDAAGNMVFVLGKVNRPSVYPMSGRTDITQALAMAGGLNTFAAENRITVLRRDAEGKQTAIAFRYSNVKNGDDLETNIILQSGDVVIVP